MFEIRIQDIVSDSYCYEQVRSIRWKEGVSCPNCKNSKVKKNGKSSQRQHYKCSACNKSFDDLTGTIFSNSKLPLKTWILCLYFMGLNLSNTQIAKELDISLTTAQSMTSQLREGINEKKLISALKMKLSLTKSTS